MLIFTTVVLAAIIFEYSNGFHDAANAIATVISTKVLTPRQAIGMAAFFNLTGALLGGAVASTIGKGLVDTNVVTMSTVLCAVIAAFVWNITTWWFGLPSSSSHALIGGLCGAALATARGNWSVLKWDAGLWPKVVLPMITSPVAGFVFGALLMYFLFVALHRLTPHFVHSLFGKMQIFSAAWMAHSHGTNDAQKTMGILTLGHRMVKLQPVHGFAAETTAALIIQGASYYGIPLSTTHVISTSIMGVGAVKRFSGMRWTVVERIIWTWLFTLPASGLIGYVLERTVGAF